MTPTKRWNGFDWVQVPKATNGVPDPDWTDVPPDGFRVVGLAPADIRTMLTTYDPTAVATLHSDKCVRVARTPTSTGSTGSTT